MGRVFISYSHKNFDIVSKVNDELRKNLILTWFDRDDIHESDYWDKHIKTAIFASDVFLMFYSKEYLTSPYCRKEFEIAKSKGGNMKIVVVGLDASSDSFSIDQQIGAIQRINYSYKTDNEEKLLSELLKSESIKSCSFVMEDIVNEKETTDFFHGISSYNSPKHYEFISIYIFTYIYAATSVISSYHSFTFIIASSYDSDLFLNTSIASTL